MYHVKWWNDPMCVCVCEWVRVLCRCTHLQISFSIFRYSWRCVKVLLAKILTEAWPKVHIVITHWIIKARKNQEKRHVMISKHHVWEPTWNIYSFIDKYFFIIDLNFAAWAAFLPNSWFFRLKYSENREEFYASIESMVKSIEWHVHNA